jgi:hypothetical protein
MADDLESEVGNATEITDEFFSKELNATVEVENDEVISQVSENIDAHSIQEDKKTQDSSENEEVSESEYLEIY